MYELLSGLQQVYLTFHLDSDRQVRERKDINVENLTVTQYQH